MLRLVGEDAGQDNFPVGMRVLAVDDDPICLKVLESLLRKCQYQGLLPFVFLLFSVFYRATSDFTENAD